MQADARHLRPWSPQHSLDSLQPPSELRPWLLHTGSLTERLTSHWPDLQVSLVHVGVGRLTPEECARLDCGLPATGWIRCVSLRGGGRTRVRARAVIPEWHSYNPWSEVAYLGERPLGDWLFAQTSVLRSPFEWASPDGPEGAGSWARRCCYTRHGAPLLLTEWMVDLTTPALINTRDTATLPPHETA